jgi:hypothetical protein
MLFINKFKIINNDKNRKIKLFSILSLEKLNFLNFNNN